MTGDGPRFRPPADTESQNGVQTTVRKPGSLPPLVGVSLSLVVATGVGVVAGFLSFDAVLAVESGLAAAVESVVGAACAGGGIDGAAVVAVAATVSTGATGGVEGFGSAVATVTVGELVTVAGTCCCARRIRNKRTPATPTTTKKVPIAAAT